MIYHTVWFQMKESTSPEDEAKMMQALRDLEGKIDGILSVGVGRDYSGRSNGYDVGLVMGFVSREAAEAYQPHPIHREFVEGYKHLWDDVKALDFEDVDAKSTV